MMRARMQRGELLRIAHGENTLRERGTRSAGCRNVTFVRDFTMQPQIWSAWLEQLGKTREISIPPKFREHVEAIIPQLRALSRHRHGTARRGALLALLHLGGEAALEQADLAVLLRLVRIKATRNAPYAFDACFNSWFAVRGGDQRGHHACAGSN